MKLTAEELQKSNSALAEERAELSNRLAEIHGIVDGNAPAESKVKVIQGKFHEWNAPKVDAPADTAANESQL
ncbi:hypothetical protein HUU59_10910 [bacterium]|nr:hypothetical protein [bacterium]